MPKQAQPIFAERGTIYARLYELQEPGKRAPIAKLCSEQELQINPETGRARTPLQQQKFLQERKAAVRRKKALQKEQARVEKTAQHKFKRVVQMYLDDKSQHDPKTTKVVLVAVHRWLEVNGNLNISDYKALHGNHYTKTCRADGLSAASVRAYLRHIRAIFNWALQQELIDKTPNFQQPALPKREPRFYSDEQIRKIESYLRDLTVEADERLRGHYTQHLRAFMLMSQTACRVGESLFLPLRLIHLDRGFIEIKANSYWKPKWLKEGILPINEKLHGFLQEDSQSRGDQEEFYLDSGYGTPLYRDHSVLNHAFRKHIKRLGFDGPNRPKTLHGFRSSVATRLIAEGADSMQVQLLLRHSSITTTGHYVATDHKAMKKLVEGI